MFLLYHDVIPFCVVICCFFPAQPTWTPVVPNNMMRLSGLCVSCLHVYIHSLPLTHEVVQTLFLLELPPVRWFDCFFSPFL